MSGDGARSSTAMQRLAGAARSNLAAFLVLTALNLSISPERFDGVVPVLHRENGDAIYSVLPLGTSLAHVLQPAELVPLRPPGKFAYSDILKYARATVDAARPAAASGSPAAEPTSGPTSVPPIFCRCRAPGSPGGRPRSTASQGRSPPTAWASW
jgi:hypothetical protein